MSGIVILGTQWGDEGKGKVTDFIAQKADMVVRYQGGNNAGHSINIDGKKYALNLVPSGVFSPKIKNVIANGVVLNPFALVEEIEKLTKQGVKNFQLYISDRAHVVMPYHIELDKLEEEYRGARKIGTTKKGIGPCYSDKHSRTGIRVIDLYDDKLLKGLITDNLMIKNLIFKHFGKPEMKVDKVFAEMKKIRTKIQKYVTDTSVLVDDYLAKNKKVLFEGAQGALLCIDHGTYPFVTSSSPTSSYAPVGVGISTKYIDKTLGIVKAYSTRVGTGGFPTELLDDVRLQNYIRETGREFGTVTGRPRRIGWFDAVLIKHTKRISGLTDLSITLLDVLTGIKTLKICTHYTLDGKKIEHIPASEKDFLRVKPVYKTVPGWTEDITKVKSFKDLPKNAQNYVKTIEKEVGVKVSMFSVGPDRKQTIEINKLF